MNIFVTSTSPVRSAQALPDRHVIKMTLESAQMASTVVRIELEDDVPAVLLQGLYRKTHPHHPCTVWARQSRANLAWLVEHGQALGAEYHRRFGRHHKSVQVLDLVASEFLHAVEPGELTPFAQAMPVEHKSTRTALAAYRHYLRAK